eukprot:586706-Rhodomonas_salina.1
MHGTSKPYSAILLRGCYATPEHISLRACYAMSGTDITWSGAGGTEAVGGAAGREGMLRVRSSVSPRVLRNA